MDLKSFMKTINFHTVEVIVNDGYNRRIKFQNFSNNKYDFEIITWEKVLCIMGYMGNYVFSRNKDMFVFFKPKDLGSINIYPDYWSSKLLSVDKKYGYRKYDPEKLHDCIKKYYSNFMILGLGMEERQSLWHNIQDEVLVHVDEEHNVYSAIDRFSFQKEGSGNIDFNDFFKLYGEDSLKSYTDNFLWCCYAIIWAVDWYYQIKKA